MDKIVAHNTITLRSPLMPYNTIARLIENKDNLKAAYRNPILQESLYIASPDLYEQLQEWLKGKDFEPKAQKKFVDALTRYMLRMAFRPTPFGLFAGVNSIVPTPSKESYVLLVNNEQYKKNLRLDMQVVGAVIQKILQEETVRDYLKFYPNSSLYRLGNQYRYLEYRYEGKSRKYHISGIGFDEFITVILQYAKEGITIGELVKELAKNEPDKEAIENYIQQLIDAQILVSELELSVTGEEAGKRLLNQLQNIPTASKYADLLNQILLSIEHVSESYLGVSVSEYQKIETLLKDADVSFEASKLFQMVLQKPVQSADIPQHYSKHILKAASLLHKFNSKKSKTLLDTFCERYVERYEEQEMPLFQVLDSETGIGFPPEQNRGGVAPLVDDILIFNNNGIQTIEWKATDNFLFSEFQQALKNNHLKIDLDEKKLNEIDFTDVKLPPTFSAMASIVYENEQEFIFLQLAGGSSANQLLGRFCHVDENIEQLCKDIATHEQSIYGDAIRAEIVHITESRLGNILQRPVLSEYEIPYLAQSVLPTEKQIAVSDLMISVRNNQVILRSKRLNKRIIPVLSSAHNFSNFSLPIYHFLCSLQFQGINISMDFNWGAIKDKVDFLPRVVYKNVILTPATWQLKKEQYKNLADAKSDDDLLVEIKQFRSQNKMPRYVAIADGDNELTLDLENVLCLNVLQGELKKRPAIILTESFVNSDKSFVKSEEGLFAHQLVFSFFNHEKPQEVLVTDSSASSVKEKVKRTFIPGDEWVYYKIYCGVSSCDEILRNVITPVVKQLLLQNVIEEWFFIRYADPKNHIRVRFKLQQGKHLDEVTSKIRFYINPYFTRGVISKIMLDTYDRELERYNFENVIFAEKLFGLDSKFCISVLERNIPQTDIWKLAIYNVYALLSDFGFSDKEKIDFAKSIKESLFEEQGLNRGNKTAREKINDKYRTAQKEINAILRKEDELVNSVNELFTERSNSNKAIIEQIIKSLPSDRTADFAGSVIHMSLNRLFSSKQRQQEMITYDFLQRALTSLEILSDKQNPLK